MELTLKLKDIYAILDRPEFYDLLPGNGEDDYIIEYLQDEFRQMAEDNEWYRVHRKSKS